MSLIRQNFHETSKRAINDQINMELSASYVYQSMAFYFDRDDVALPGFSRFFSENSKEEREHAEMLMKYLNKRGGRVVLQEIRRPEMDNWGSGLNALQIALGHEQKVNESLLRLHSIASQNNDAHLTNYLESEFLDEQVDAIKKLSDLITQLKRVGAQGLGEQIFDKDLMNLSMH